MVFLFTSVVFISFALVVERRQGIVMAAAIDNAKKVATTERQLNEFLAHEIRNPLSAAISACSFVSSVLDGGGGGAGGIIAGEMDNDHDMPYNSASSTTTDVKKALLDDVKVIDTSLSFINDFLRSVLDMHRAAVDDVELMMSPTNLLKDVLEPVCTMLRQRGCTFAVSCECCPHDLVVLTQPLCLKQILLHLGALATNSVVTGFVRFRVAVVKGCVELYVEDSGPAIPVDARITLFEKHETEFYDMAGGGTGTGLCFSKHLVQALQGDIWLDETYESGIPGNPGSRFVIALQKKTSPSPSIPVLLHILLLLFFLQRLLGQQQRQGGSDGRHRRAQHHGERREIPQ